jgi:hypothetical protein
VIWKISAMPPPWNAETSSRTSSWALGLTVAVLSGMAIWAMRPNHLRREQALRSGYTALLVLLLLGNLLSSYVSQFTILAQAAVQVAALGLLARWDRATGPSRRSARTRDGRCRSPARSSRDGGRGAGR